MWKVQGDHHQLDPRLGVQDPAHHQGREDVGQGHRGESDAQPLARGRRHPQTLQIFPQAWEDHGVLNPRDEHEQVDDGETTSP